MRITPITLIALITTLSASAGAANSAQPSPYLSPREVVQLQLAALKTVDQPFKDAGFATVFRFTSPNNRAQTGPLPRFSKMIRDGFGDLINHKSAVLLPLVQQADEVLQPVEITSFGGRTYRYVFVLRQQDDGDCRRCWMTDGVVPQDARDSGSQAL